ncbi:hypothetical protein [Streptomyces californicus]|uniref:hypothetical protein n=1 Tax=Streptomyces californicus TaxID=67351 RepID=UPI00296FFFA4|nr:hypothetical protein [Streptomyces californicus]MDW4912497.1 hypothetical protein [Streptomyces californicus]
MATTYTEATREITPACSQRAVAFALAQLLTDYPELPTPHWTIPIPQSGNDRVLYGHLQSEYETLEAFLAYVKVLGGVVTSCDPAEMYGRVVRTHTVVAQWEGIQVDVTVILPASVDVQAAL